MVMRVFTAIPLPQEVKDKFSEIARGKLPVPYVNTTNFHVTLNFLGELDSDQSAKVQEYWTKDMPEFRRFRVEFDKLVMHRHQIHMTVKGNPKLMEMQDTLRKHFESQGYKPSYPSYYPHVTIAKLHMDNVMNRERKIESFPNQELEQLSFEADRITLVESKLLLHHPKHIELAEHKLK
jgi:RNA 2',3'-cyclic 3'-phosphodiesterase